MRIRRLCCLLVLLVGCNGTKYYQGKSYSYDPETNKYVKRKEEPPSAARKAAIAVLAPVVVVSEMGTMNWGN